MNATLFFADTDGYEELTTASYRILVFNWAIYSFLVGNSFSGCILAFMNVRLYDHGVNSVSALEEALQRKSYTGGTIRDSYTSAMLDVCERRSLLNRILLRTYRCVLSDGDCLKILKFAVRNDAADFGLRIWQDPMDSKVFRMIRDRTLKDSKLLVENLEEGILMSYRMR